MSRDYWGSIFEFRECDGVLIYKARPQSEFKSKSHALQWNSTYAGREAGFVKKSSARYKCICVSVEGKVYRAHRIAAVLAGILPSYSHKHEIDHIDGNPMNNKLCNLRAANRTQNARNQRLHITNKSGVSGVYRERNKPGWYVQIYSGSGKKVRLGVFNDFFEAVCARKSKELRLGYFKNHGLERNPPAEGEGL